MNVEEVLNNIKTGQPNTRDNPVGITRLDLNDVTTKKYVEAGFYIDVSGYIYDTLFWPGDSVKLKPGLEVVVKSVRANEIRIVESISIPNGYYNDNTKRADLTSYKLKGGYLEYLKKATLKLIGVSNPMLADKFEFGANTMNLLEANKPTFVREFTEEVVDGESVRKYVGPQTEYKTLTAAKTFVSNTISESIRHSNSYRKFAIFQEVYVARAKQPEVEFV